MYIQIEDLIRAGGVVMYPLLFLSIVAIAIIIERTIVFFQIGNSGKGLLIGTLRNCQNNEFDRALEATQRASGPVAASLATILEHRSRPVEFVERYVQEIGEEYFLRLEKHLSILDTITTVSPLLGLLGTIVGMIGAFDAISAQQAAGNNDFVLHGVAEALYATATGITVAVISFIAYNYFAARVKHLTSESEIASTKLLNLLEEKKAA